MLRDALLCQELLSLGASQITVFTSMKHKQAGITPSVCCSQASDRKLLSMNDHTLATAS